ncbi:MAG: DUF512 domain-containing protein [Clostridia bacterium]|nr:DUF512 domain-containing protein [Clostridia bacterium]
MYNEYGMLKITKVQRNSLAKELGLEKGDEIVAFDGLCAEDELDLTYYSAQSTFTMTVKNKRSGETVTLDVEKGEDEELGVEVQKNDTIRTCHNRCVFCFVDQMPKGLRESLYVKDDDYGMSFSCGNFVTLTNLSDEGLQRIIRLKLSPLYISVHTMNPELRVKLLRNRFAGKIVSQIYALAKAGIEMHCQAVIVPGENDGDELAFTARELFQYYPFVKDLAVVPTGLTKYRMGLTEIADVDEEYSRKFLAQVDKLNGEFGAPFVHPADEYFVKAKKPFKDAEFYGDFSQIENGIGMTSKFSWEARSALSSLELEQGKISLKKPKKSIVISGVSAKSINETLCREIEQKIDGLTTEVLAVENDFFGHTVTCTGLLTGVDIAKAVEKYRLENGAFDEIILPSNTLKEFEEVFLCGTTLKQLKKQLKCKNIRVNYQGGSGLVKLLSKEK